MKLLKNKCSILWACLLFGVLLTTGCGNQTAQSPTQPSSTTNNGQATSPAQSKELVKWKHGIVKAKNDSSFQLMAKEKEFFKKHGVDVEYTEFVGDVTLLQALVAGQLDSMEANPAGTITAVQKGAKLKIIGSTLPVNPYALYVKKGINSFEELKGKAVGVSTPGSLPEFILKAMLKAKGVDPNSVTLVNSGSDSERYQSLVAGKIYAAAAASDFVINAKQDGINILGYAADLIPQYPRFVIVANEKSLQEKPGAAVGFLAAEMEGLTYALNHKDEALTLAAKTMNVPVNNESIAAVYDEAKSKGYVSPKAEIPVEKIEWLQNFLIELGKIDKKVDVNSLIDGSYREKALKEANVQ